ncbi:uncharacterized protein [Ptychodera flava]|uniref:uncharacterized protein n=1 Tax=Ptychodera flava TaxID=63121 RepID=UPI00396A64DD
MKQLLCSIYAPVCTVLEDPIPPCRALCQAAKDGCSRLMGQYGFQWHDVADCGDLPTVGLCVGFDVGENIETTEPPTNPLTTETTNKASPRCEPLTVPLCQGLGYSETILPNFLNHESQNEARLEVHQFWPLIEAECSPHLKRFLCYTYAPVCILVEDPIPPCRGLCQTAKDRCAGLMQRFGVQWPDSLDCELFPADGLCLGSGVCEVIDKEVTEPQTDRTTTEATKIERPRCEPLTIPLCQGLGYNETIFPNILNHESQEEAAFEVNQFWPLIEAECSPHLKRFLCSVYAPVCTVLEDPIPPCRALCKAAKDGCGDLLRRNGLRWSDSLKCRQFPSDGLCLGLEFEEPIKATEPPTSQITTVSTQANRRRCEPLTIPLCQDVGYNATLFPNYLNQTSQDDAALEVRQYFPMVKLQCSPHLKRFLCFIYAPVCTLLEELVPPCRESCQAAKEGCEQLMAEFAFPWPDKFNCDQFPPRSDRLCLE